MTSGHDHDRGLSFDLATMAGRRWMDRRRALQVVAGAGVAALVGCGSGDDGGRATATTTTTSGDRSTSTAAGGGSSAAGSGAECSTIPEETAGRAEGVPVTLDLEILDGASGCAPLPGAAVYVWHCDRADGSAQQLATASGSAADGFALRLPVVV